MRASEIEAEEKYEDGDGRYLAESSGSCGNGVGDVSLRSQSEVATHVALKSALAFWSFVTQVWPSLSTSVDMSGEGLGPEAYLFAWNNVC